jgi:hypothetical protein
MTQPENDLPVREVAAAAEEVATADTGKPKDPALPGTLFVLMLFLAGVVGLWGTVYWMLLTR